MAALAVLGGLLVYNYWPSESDKIIISRETTYILGPVNPDGTVNYVKYLDDKCAQGVTAANNAAPLLLRAFGPDMLPARIRSETLSRLNLPADIFDGDKHFIEWKDRARPGKAAANSSAGPKAGRDDNISISEVHEMLLAGQVHPDLEAWLASNAGPMELICQAVKKERFYLPLVSPSNPPYLVDVIIPNWMGYRQAADALAMRARLNASRNDMRGVWDDVLTAQKLARLLDRSPFLIVRLVGLVADARVGEAGIEIATRYPMQPAEGRGVLTRLIAAQSRANIVDTIDEGERCLELDAAMMLSRVGQGRGQAIGGVPVTGSSDLDWNQALRELNAWRDAMVEPMRLPRFHGQAEAWRAYNDMSKKFQAETKSTRGMLIKASLIRYGGRLARGARTTLITNVLIAILEPAFGGVVDKEDEVKMACEIETLAVALACFRAEQGRWPAELKELCPSLLKEIPADRFSTSPLVYRPNDNGYLLYSVGRNLRDDGGQSDSRRSGMSSDERKDDIVAEVKPRQAASKPAASQP